MIPAEPLTAPPPFLAFTMADVEQANADWGANCGPAALAACLGWTLDDVRPHLGDFERRGYMNPSMMKSAIRGAEHQIRLPHPDHLLPVHGLVRVQWGGPWLDPGVPVSVAYARTHWIATKKREGEFWVYDVNAGWLELLSWRRDIATRLIASMKRADGTYQYIDRWEVRRAR